MNETWGEIYEYEGHMNYANEYERRLAETNRAQIAWIAQNHRPENVAVELVPAVFERLAREHNPSAYPLRNYRIVMVRRPQAPEAKAA
ncbi:hypothetical protein HYW35_04250 [Candidatus Saccharibacteria bacterium]|nr:hypothetical protein [Candidatus Saccharibacteria bacterium]